MLKYGADAVYDHDDALTLRLQPLHRRAYLRAGLPRGKGLIIQPYDLTFRKQRPVMFTLRCAAAFAVDIQYCLVGFAFSFLVKDESILNLYDPIA